MGFSIGYSELLLPRVLLHVALLLGYVRQFIFRALDSVGLGDLLDADAPWPENSSYNQLEHHHHYHNEQLQRRPQFRWRSATMIQENIPVVRYEELVDEAADWKHIGGSCVVCLNEFEAVEEVRRLSNCRHVFHRCCLDRWLDHEQSTCPLCRSPLLAGEAETAFEDQMWTAAVMPESYYDDIFSVPFAYPTAPPSQILHSFRISYSTPPNTETLLE